MNAHIKRLIPQFLLRALLPAYHFSLALLGAVIYRFPSRKLIVIGVTGTKGKTSTTEILNNILEASGAKTAILGTLRFKIGERSDRNLKKMTMPGRFFVQKFLRDAVREGCTHAIIEMTSEGAVQFRQRFIDMDALIFTNLAPEHIESHGSYEAYRDAKLSIAHTLSRSSKPKRFMVANTDDTEGKRFLETPNVAPIPFSLKNTEPIEADEKHIALTWKGTRISSPLGGLFNASNILGAATCADALGITVGAITEGVSRTTQIDGRMERIECGQTFPVIVDYAHTPDSLKAVYTAFANYANICVLGNTGGGRDKWKRPVMGEIADKYCAHIILTNEDPYDEDPQAILLEMKRGMKTKTPEIIIDRREAIVRAITLAKEFEMRLASLDEVQGDEMSVSEGAYSRKSSGPLIEVNAEIRQTRRSPAVLITGKGTDPYIMGANGEKIPWDDHTVATEVLQNSLGT
jgi:UDP-N-acetylmuramoyl-L-alanyl-D-glutamate--2,6-diaminopimelate ligase